MRVIGLIVVSLMSAVVFAQWTSVRTPNVPRLPDGKVDLKAKAPKMKDGKPDLQGIWNPTPAVANIMGKSKEEPPMNAEGKAMYEKRRDGALAHEEPDANCLPQGTPKINAAPVPWKLIQLPDQIVILYEAFTQWRQIFTDGRPLPVDPNPTWFGYSVGKWEGDTLVVESNGFNGRIWLDSAGHPTTEKMRVTERFRRPDFGHLEIGITIDDPGAYTRPWSTTYTATFLADSELIEFICLENEKDIEHLTPKK